MERENNVTKPDEMTTETATETPKETPTETPTETPKETPKETQTHAQNEASHRPAKLPRGDQRVLQTLSDSATDFLNVVWPRIAMLEMVGGGQLQPVEAVAENKFKDQLDLLAGIDAWQILASPSAIRGLASRVQWGLPRRTFTIRTRSKGGGETELDKRARAIANRDQGHLFPHFTVQAYLDERRGKLRCAAVTRTVDLFSVACFLRENMKGNRDLYGYWDNDDGSQFMYIAWTYLAFKRECQIFCVQGPRRLFHGAARRSLSRARACGAVVKSDLILPHDAFKAVFIKYGELVHCGFPVVRSATPIGGDIAQG